MQRVLVTGPDGLLGSNLVRALLRRSYRVRAMIQSGRKVKTLDGLDIEKVSCDISDSRGLNKAVKGCDAIIHAAALSAVWPFKGKIYYTVNVEGTQNMINAAQNNRVNRFIYIGSASSFGFGPKNQPGHEKNPYVSGKYRLDYMDTKFQAQELVLEAYRYKGLPALVVNPTFMIGPYDSGPTSGAMIVAAAKGKLLGTSSGGKNWIYVKDVAEAICNALTMGKLGEAYILGHENLSYKEAISLIYQVLGKKSPQIVFPDPIVKISGMIGSLTGILTNSNPSLTYPLARIACDGHYFSPEKAINELGLPQTPVLIGIKEAYDWFRENKYLP